MGDGPARSTPALHGPATRGMIISDFLAAVPRRAGLGPLGGLGQRFRCSPIRVGVAAERGGARRSAAERSEGRSGAGALGPGGPQPAAAADKPPLPNPNRPRHAALRGVGVSCLHGENADVLRAACLRPAAGATVASALVTWIGLAGPAPPLAHCWRESLAL